MRTVFAIHYYIDGTLPEPHDFVGLKPFIWYRKLEMWQNKSIVKGSENIKRQLTFFYIYN